MPLEVDKDDPTMIAAIKNAKNSLDEFKKSLNQYPKEGHVKVPFSTSSGETEFLWGDVTKLINNDLDVFLTTPPVTHEGKMDRNVKYDLNDIVDWTVTVPKEKIKGGFTMKAMFKIYEEKYGELPEILRKEKNLYE
tara:strand:+ start:101 stop:508 length:408 start_codon:yes stop_codon:yes gene_type:complete